MASQGGISFADIIERGLELRSRLDKLQGRNDRLFIYEHALDLETELVQERILDERLALSKAELLTKEAKVASLRTELHRVRVGRDTTWEMLGAEAAEKALVADTEVKKMAAEVDELVMASDNLVRKNVWILQEKASIEQEIVALCSDTIAHTTLTESFY